MIVAALFALGILGLFMLDAERKERTSKWLWIPTIWMLIASSRNLAEWLQIESPGDLTDLGDRYLDGNPLDRDVMTGLLALGIFVLVRRRRQTGALLRGNVPLLLFFSYCALSTVWSDHSGPSAKRWIKASGDLVMVLVVLSDPDWFAALKRLLARTGFVVIPLSILFIRYYPDLGRAYSPWDGALSYTGVTTNKNSLGMICMTFGLASVWRILETFRGANDNRRAGPLIAHGALVAMALWLMWKADSMTALSCFVLAGGMMVLMSRPVLVRKPAIVHLLVVMVLSLASSVLLLNVGGGLVQGLGRDSTFTGRTELWNLVAGMTTNPLLGAGYESFWTGERLQKIWRIYWNHPNQAHNGYLEVFLNLGWLGVALLGFVMVTAYRTIVAAVGRQSPAGKLRLAYLVAAAVYNLTETAFKMTHPLWIAFLLAVVIGPEREHRKKGARALRRERVPFEPSQTTRLAGLPFAILGLVGIILVGCFTAGDFGLLTTVTMFNLFCAGIRLIPFTGRPAPG